jgi:hypothetical protein
MKNLDLNKWRPDLGAIEARVVAEPRAPRAIDTTKME